MASWSVISTIREELDVTLRFVAYHLSLGAEQIFIFLYDPDDPAAEILEKHPKVTVTRCDEAYWQKHIGKKRPISIPKAQVVNLNEAYKQCTTDWCTHIDADEYIYSPEHSIDQLLDGVKEDMVIMPPYEPILYTDENNALFFMGEVHRKRSEELSAIIGAPLKTCGVIGHQAGKVFTRCGLKNVHLDVHRSRLKEGNEPAVIRKIFVPDLYLLHYLNFGPRGWAMKFTRYIKAEKFEGKYLNRKKSSKLDQAFFQHIFELYKQGGSDAIADLFRKTRFLNNQQIIGISLFANLIEFEFDFSKAMYDEFGDIAPKGQNSYNILMVD